MRYYEIAVGSNKYHGHEPLTYAFADVLPPGTLVRVSLRSERALGFVVASVAKPAFLTKTIDEVLADIPPLPHHLVQLFLWVCQYYPAPLGITAQLFLPKDIPRRQPSAAPPDKTDNTIETLPPLTTEQAAALARFETHGTHLLHGETGSGKTRIYIELARKAIADGTSAIVLTPEISLTSQLVRRFIEAFGESQIIVMHSGMTAAKRRDAWLRAAAQTTPCIIIGARSALFAPVAKLGLIVLDEAHDSAYKQENAPYYHSARVAGKLAELCKAPVVLGSATPSVADYYIAQTLKRPIIRLTQPALGTPEHNTTETTIIDLRNQANLTRNPYISDALLRAIEQQLRNEQQTLLFLNRRGTARIVFCQQCGWQANCPHCDLPLTYHHDSHRFRCHACDYAEKARSNCPTCGNADITLKSVGTKTIAAAIERLFPSARVQRFDADNATGDRVHEQYDALHAGEIDIIIGTQLIAKGFDLPRLSLIGVINADSSLNIPDYAAQERTYQLLYQVLGRVGRGHQAGRAIIQTYSPDDPTITAAIHKDWEQFLGAELTERKTFLFPPFCHLLKVTCTRATQASAIKTASKVQDMLAAKLHCVIEGPAPAFHEKARGKYTWQLIIKSKQRSELLSAIALLPKDWSFDIDPVDLL